MHWTDPGLSPIENIWHIIKRKIRQRRPQNDQKLKSCVRKEWGNFYSQNSSEWSPQFSRVYRVLLKEEVMQSSCHYAQKKEFRHKCRLLFGGLLTEVRERQNKSMRAAQRWSRCTKKTEKSMRRLRGSPLLHLNLAAHGWETGTDQADSGRDSLCYFQWFANHKILFLFTFYLASQLSLETGINKELKEF